MKQTSKTSQSNSIACCLENLELFLQEEIKEKLNKNSEKISPERIIIKANGIRMETMYPKTPLFSTSRTPSPTSRNLRIKKMKNINTGARKASFRVFGHHFLQPIIFISLRAGTV